MINHHSPDVAGYANQIQSYSQIGQDVFVTTCLQSQSNGRYLEIGASDPVNINNTYQLERMFNWQGISLDILPEVVTYFNSVRKNKAVCMDATTANYDALLDNMGWADTHIVDYASIDCEPPENTFKALLQVMLSGYKFRVITFEHDTYQATLPVKQMSRALLINMGYELIVGGIMGSATWHDQEDWYVHPELVDMDHVNKLRSNENNIFWAEYINRIKS